ncbi:MAG: bla regulator protein BlaR1 [Alteromonadaceae bacterium]|jgi:bla regulator protein BlaR1
MQDNFLSSPILYSLALTLIHFIWQGVLVAAVLKLALMFTSHQKSQLRYGYSTLAMLVNLLLPFITFFILYKPNYLPFPSQAALTSAVDAASQLGIIQQNFWYSNIAEYLPYLAMAWLTIITILASKLLIELYTVNQLPRRNIVPADAKLTTRFNALVVQLGLNNPPRLVISLKTNVPIAIGWLKPVVLIPVSMLTGLTPNQLDMLILHELAHIRRHDYLVNFIQTLVEILLFFHPAVLWVSNQMRNEREYCSDDIAVQSCGDAIAYAHTLADTASLCHKHRNRSIPSMAMAASGGDLKQRVVRLIDQHHCTSSNDASKWLASIVIIFSIVLIASQQFLQLHHIDFNSGNISLYRSADDATFTEGVNKVIPRTSKNSIAQQLLAGKKNEIKNEPDHIAQTTIEENAIARVAFSKGLNGKTQGVAAKSSTNKSIVNKSIVTASTKTLLSKQDLKNESEFEHVDVTTQIARQSTVNENAIDESKISSVVTIHKKYSAELAFARTDSKNQLKNPYANQIASLLNSTHNIIEENSFKTLPITPDIATNIEIKSPAIKNTSAEVITSLEPKYPASAKRKGIELEVLVDFIIDKNGRVKDIYFEPKSKLSYFRSAIRYAMEKWRFDPAVVNGHAVESKMSKIFSFSLLN